MIHDQITTAIITAPENFKKPARWPRHGHSGPETKAAHAASKAICAKKRKTRLADRAAERKSTA